MVFSCPTLQEQAWILSLLENGQELLKALDVVACVLKSAFFVGLSQSYAIRSSSGDRFRSTGLERPRTWVTVESSC